MLKANKSAYSYTERPADYQSHQPLAYVDVWRMSTLWVFTWGADHSSRESWRNVPPHVMNDLLITC